MGTPGGTSAQEARTVPTPAFEEANLFELRYGTSEITFTTRDIVGEPALTYTDGIETWSFRGDEIHLVRTETGTLATVTLKMIPDLEMRLLTLVLPVVLVNSGKPEKLSAPVLFTRVEMSIAGLPLHPGPVQTYDVKIFNGTASSVVP